MIDFPAIPEYASPYITRGEALDEGSHEIAQMEDPAQLARTHEMLVDLRKRAGNWQDALRDLIYMIEARMLSQMDQGESIETPSGRRATIGMGKAGARASVRPEAVLELGDALPERLRVRYTPVYPGVGAIRKALEEREITRAQHDELIAEPEQVPVIRWETVKEEEVVDGD